MSKPLVQYWVVHFYTDKTLIDHGNDNHDCFRIFTDLSLMLRSLQKFVNNEPMCHPTWHLPFRILTISEGPLSVRDVTGVMVEEASHAVFSEHIMNEEEPSAMPIFAHGEPL